MNTPSAPSAALPRASDNPALAAFLTAPWQEIAFAQTLIRRAGQGFELRHVEDAAQSSLNSIALSEVRALANFTEAKEYRPLKTVPNLRRGWVLRVQSSDELEFALSQLYPGALPDWFAAQKNPIPVTDYRPFTERQTGMYRVTTMLADEEVSTVIDQTCGAICLKRRLWTVGSKAVDAPQIKSIIPCLEPCAILLENARKTARERQNRELNLPNPAPH